MLDLENFGLVELNAQEVVEVNGGGFFRFIWRNIIVSAANDIAKTTSNTANNFFNYLTGNTQV